MISHDYEVELMKFLWKIETCWLKWKILLIFFLTEKPSFRKAPVDQITMEGKAVHFPCEVVGDQPISVEWRKENGALKYGRVRVLKDNTLRIEKAEAEDAGLYVCMASNSVGTAEAVARLTVQCK